MKIIAVKLSKAKRIIVIINKILAYKNNDLI